MTEVFAPTTEVKKINKTMLVWAVLSVVYILLTPFLPLDPVSIERYHATLFKFRLIQLSIALPLIIIWFIAFYAYSRFQRYFSAIKDSKEGAALEKIANGLAVLAYGLPVSALISTIVGFYSRNSSLTETSPNAPTAVIINLYISIIIALFAYTFLVKGSYLLLKALNIVPTSSERLKNIIIFVLFGGLYVVMVFLNPNRQIPAAPGLRATYYLPDSLIAITVILPYLYAWYAGFTASMNLRLYQKKVVGVIYKKALSGLSWGIFTVVLSSIGILYLGAFGPVFAGWGLNAILLLVYLLLILISAGYIMIALGAKKLVKIETVV